MRPLSSVFAKAATPLTRTVASLSGFRANGATFRPTALESLSHFPVTIAAHLSAGELVVLVEVLDGALGDLDPAELGERVVAVAPVADGRRAFLGSQNFDWRALKHIHETGLLVTLPRLVRQIQEIFELDWKAEAEYGGYYQALVKGFEEAFKGRSVQIALSGDLHGDSSRCR